MTLLDIRTGSAPGELLATIRSRVLLDGFDLLVDLENCHGSRLMDLLSGDEFLDFYSFFASYPIGYNHPRLREPEFQHRLLTAATTKVANSDMCTPYYADFVRTVDEVCGVPGFRHFFFIDGGTLAVENALKVAFDWKVRKNLAAGRGEVGHRVIHFRQAFHGRSGYTLSMTNTADPRKTMYFPKFEWPRIDNPRIDFALPEPGRTADVIRREAAAVAQIQEAIARHGPDIAALIIEPIQGEGGDNHFRGEFLRALREICDRSDILLIFDEVQTGLGITGKMWACEHFDVSPDVLCFGKKMQTCGFLANTRVDEVESVFKVSSRINSTWGGNLADFVRATQLLRIIQEEGLVQRAAATGAYLLERLQRLARKHSLVTAPRGRGLMCAFDLPDTKARDLLRKRCFERRMLVLGCGERSIRFRPVLDVEESEIDCGFRILDEALATLAR
jgi:L-lysine 6-transaminase